MKTIFRNSIHKKDKSHDCLICEINGKKVKITYESYNAVERCNTDIFDGHSWNHFLSMLDMGITPENTSYIWEESKREKRANELIKKAEKMCKDII